MSLSKPRLDVTKYLISSPARFTGSIETASYSLFEAWDNFRIEPNRASHVDRHYRFYMELTVATPVYNGKDLVIPDYSHVAENFCIALSVLFGKRFDSHGILQQHGRSYVPSIRDSNKLYRKELCFNSLNERVDFNLGLDLDNFSKIHNVFFTEDGKKDAVSTFLYAARFYSQSLRIVEESPEVAFLGLITAGEILATHFKYPVEQLLSEEHKELIEKLKSLSGIHQKLQQMVSNEPLAAELREFASLGTELHAQVTDKLRGSTEAFCKVILEFLDADFFKRGEAKSAASRLTESDIKMRLKAAYDLRSKYVHAGKSASSWMSVSYLRDNEEVMSGSPVVEDKDLKRALTRSPTFIGMERLLRYALIKFLIKTDVISPF